MDKVEPGKKLKKVVGATVTEGEQELIRRAAAAENRTVSAWARLVLLAAVGKKKGTP